MKLAATWTRRHRGVAIGLIVGALTVGSASPHLVRSLFDGPWEYVVAVSSGLAALGGAVVWLAVREGPFAVAGAKFEPRFIVQIMRSRGMRLANLGYFGHQWELYAMWTWVPISWFSRSLRAAFRRPPPAAWPSRWWRWAASGRWWPGSWPTGWVARR